MANFDFTEVVRKTAQTIRQNTSCLEHNKRLEFQVVKTSDGATVNWDFCCDKLKVDVERKYKPAIEKAMGEAMQKSLSDIFKRK